MSKMFCVECGKEDPIFRDGVCVNCYLKSNTLTKGPEIIDLQTCPHCDAFKYKNTWTSELLGDVLRKIIKNVFQINRDLKKVDINTDCKDSKDGYDCKVYISGFIDDAELTEEHDLVVRLKKTACDVCSKKFGGYHEAVIQIRGDDRKLSKDEIENIYQFVENRVGILQSKGNRSLFITDVGEEHGGLDFFISDKGAALVITKKIQGEYGGKIKQSSKDMGMKDSKQIYRMTYLLRLPPWKRDDFIEKDNKVFLILSAHGNNVKMIDLSSWSEIVEDIKTMHKVKILGGKELIKEMILVSQTKNEVQIMHPENYNIKVVRKPKPVNFKSEKIKIIEINNQIFLIIK